MENIKLKRFNEEFESDERKNDNITNQEICADIRNKLGPMKNLIAFCKGKTYENEKFKDLFEREIFKSDECLNYILEMLKKIK